MLRFVLSFVLLPCVLLPLAVAQTTPDAAATPERVLLWPDGAPGARGNEAKDRPNVLVYLAPRDANTAQQLHPAVVICPGGGYQGLAMDHEGHQIARWLNTLDITGVILDYRHRGKGYGHPAPLLDVQRALRLVRHRADDWHVDAGRLGVLGFSAGGHLAASASVHHDAGSADADDAIERLSCRPDFAVLCYPVIAFDQDFTHKGSQRNLLGADASAELVRQMSAELQVDSTTPPTFLWHTSADRAVPPQNSIAFYQALLQNDVPCELHLFEQGRHGLGLAKGHPAELWPELCRRWLLARKVLYG